MGRDCRRTIGVIAAAGTALVRRRAQYAGSPPARAAAANAGAAPATEADCPPAHCEDVARGRALLSPAGNKRVTLAYCHAARSR